MKKLKKIVGNKEVLIILVILLVATLLRLYRIDTPLAEFHSWRQVESANIAQLFVNDEGNLIEKLHTMSNSTHYIEFPLYNYIFAKLHVLIPFFSLTTAGRIVSTIFSLLTITSIYYIARKESSLLTATVAAVIFAIFPFFVFFSRAILPEVPAVALAMAAVALCHQSFTKNSAWKQYLYIVSSALSLALGIMIKPPVIVFIIPIIFLFIRTYELTITKRGVSYLYIFLTIIPIIAWLAFLNFPTVLPGETSLFSTVYTAQGEAESILFSPLFFRTVFFERITNVILGGLMFFPLAAGLITKRQPFLFTSIGISSIIFLLVFQGGNLLYTYYQIVILPAIALYIGLGIHTLWRQKGHMVSTFTLIPVLSLIIVASMFFSFSTVRTYYAYSEDLIRIARIINTLTQPSDRIVTDQSGDTTLLYLANREGAASFEKDINSYIEEGYDYLLTSNSDKMESIKQQNTYEIVFQNDQFILFQI